MKEANKAQAGSLCHQGLLVGLKDRDELIQSAIILATALILQKYYEIICITILIYSINNIIETVVIQVINQRL